MYFASLVPKCPEALTKEVQIASDRQLSASNMYNGDPRHGPNRARLDSEKNENGFGAWTADENEKKPWIQVCVGTPHSLYNKRKSCRHALYKCQRRRT
jgi:hypothetical protein